MASTNNGELRMAVADRRSYLTKSYLLLGLCLADIGLNSFADHFHRPDEGRFYPMVLIGYVGQRDWNIHCCISWFWYAWCICRLQFLVQVLNLLTLSMLFFGTYVVQVGLLNLLLRNFRVECFIIPAYFVIFLVYAAIKSVRNENKRHR